MYPKLLVHYHIVIGRKEWAGTSPLCTTFLKKRMTKVQNG